MARFGRVLEAMRGDPSPGWSLLALECGFYDQAHLIRDFRSFAGVSPGRVPRGEAAA